jgi:very-short-patch-repair endonuclease
MKIIKHCSLLECGRKLELIPSKISINNFCSRSCAAKFNNTKRRLSEETKNKIRNTLITRYPKRIKVMKKIVMSEETKNKIRDAQIKYHARKPYVAQYRSFHVLNCLICNNIFNHKSKNTKTCSIKCRYKLLSQISSDSIKNNRLRFKGPHTQSYMERTFEEWLKNNNFKKGFNGYLTEVHFYNKNMNKNGWIDFLFPKFKLIVELDGKHHIKRKHLDDLRDIYLINRGWKIFRISYKEYQNKSLMPQLCVILRLVRPIGVEPTT